MKQKATLKLSGLEPLIVTSESNFINVGERTNVTGSRAFLRMIKEEDYEAAMAVARDQVEGGAQIIDINMTKITAIQIGNGQFAECIIQN